jgi:hypothetical protein
MKAHKPTTNHVIPKVAQPKAMTPHKAFKPRPHPHQDRLEQHRTLPSLVTDVNKNPVKEKA